jgi:hypothetical protein
MTLQAPCMVPSMLRGVRMSHSDDLTAVFHGNVQPAIACGFHAAHYAPEVFAAHREILACRPCHTVDVCPVHGDAYRLSVESAAGLSLPVMS